MYCLYTGLLLSRTQDWYLSHTTINAAFQIVHVT